MKLPNLKAVPEDNAYLRGMQRKTTITRNPIGIGAGLN